MKSPYTVVVAEDEELLLDNLIDKIHQLDLGFIVTGMAQTGEEALEQVRLHSPDLLVTDIRMPVMDGMALLSRVADEYPDMKSVIISGYSDFEYAKEALKYHVHEYLLKPVDREELKNTLLHIRTELDLKKEELISELSLSSITTKEKAAEVLKDYIRANYERNFNLEDIVSRIDYSPDYVTKAFTALYGMSPVKYAISLRVHKAQHLLFHNPELSIQQVGEMVGYEDISYFSRIFKKYAGVSPGQYREKELKEIPATEDLPYPEEP